MIYYDDMSWRVHDPQVLSCTSTEIEKTAVIVAANRDILWKSLSIANMELVFSTCTHRRLLDHLTVAAHRASDT